MASTAFSSLPISHPDDSMEMTSPANRALDDEIDIDFDYYPSGGHVPEDELMAVDPARPGTGTDDTMEDDTLVQEEQHMTEEVMQDDAMPMPELLEEEDEELIDYGDDEIQDDPLGDTLVAGGVMPIDTGGYASGELEKDDLGSAHHDDLLHQPNVEAAEIAGGEDSLELGSSSAGHIDEHTADTTKVAYPSSQHGVTDEAQDLNNATSLVYGTEEPPADEHDNVQPAISIDTTLRTEAESPSTPTDTGLHPMYIRYGDLQLPLFRSQREPDGLLKNDNIANLSLNDLITSCRERMAIKTGENISEDQEIALCFDHLGLMLIEESKAAFTSSLADVLEVYLHLHRNDAVTNIPPLSMSISLQLKFASSFNILKQAAEDGQGLSSFVSLQPNIFESTHRENHGHDGHDEEDEDEAEAVELPEDASAQPELTAPELQFDDDADDAEDADEQDVEYYEEHDIINDITSGDYDEAPLDPENNTLVPAGTSAVLDEAEEEEEGPSEARQSHVALEPEMQNDTRASSATIQGDQTINNAGHAGEYDEIDWDDDTLTGGIAELAKDEVDPTDLPEGSVALFSHEDTEPQDTPAGEAKNQNADVARFEAATFYADNEDHTADQVDHDEYYDEEGDHQLLAADHEPVVYGAEAYPDEADAIGEQHDYENHPDQDYLALADDGEDELHDPQQGFFEDGMYEHGLEHTLHDDADEEGLDDTINTVVHHHIEGHNDEEDDLEEDDLDQADEQYGIEDDLGFDDEENTDGLQESAAEPIPPETGIGKRSFDELEDELDWDTEEPEVKKSRPS